MDNRRKIGDINSSLQETEKALILHLNLKDVLSIIFMEVMQRLTDVNLEKVLMMD